MRPSRSAGVRQQIIEMNEGEARAMDKPFTCGIGDPRGEPANSSGDGARAHRPPRRKLRQMLFDLCSNACTDRHHQGVHVASVLEE